MPLKLRDLFSEDLDRVFAYRTSRFVVIKDVWLGCAHKLLQMSIFLYVVIYALVWNEGYIKKEFAIGTTMIIKDGGEIVIGSNNRGIYILRFILLIELYFDHT